VGGFQGGPPPGPPPSFGGASDASTSTQSASTLSGVSTDTASSLASQLISALGDSKTGEISLSEFETGVASALGVSSSSGLTSSQTTAVTDAFNAIDANGDGELSQSELATAIQDLQQGGPPEGPPPSFGQGAPSATDVASGIMQSLTGSSSGTLSLSDVETAYAQSIGDSSASSLTSDQTSTLTSAFKAIDADGDGQISVAELATALQSYMPWLNDSSSGASSAASSTTSSTSITA
jgi:Ca2+-binding EF-hand superfamily protein